MTLPITIGVLAVLVVILLVLLLGRQLFITIFGFLIASVLIFLFGMWVGRDMAERRLVQEERVVRQPMPVQPTVSEEGKQPDIDVSFYQQLKEKAYRRLEETPTAIPPTAARTVQATPTPTLVPPTAPRLAPTAPRPALPTAPRPALPTPQRPPVRATQAPTAASAVPPVKTPTAAGPPPPHNAEEWAAAGWTVQVIATTDIRQATELARSLRAKGYDAYTVQSPMRGQAWYRVRVGTFTNREKAKELETKLKTVEGLDNAYVTAR